MKRFVLLLCLLCAGCREARSPSRSQSQSPDTGGTAVIALPTDIDFANGLLSGEGYSQEINRNALFLTLLQYDKKLELAPLLARSWQMFGDTAVELKLRDDVRWHDGVKTTAYDVAFTYRYGANPETGYPNADYWTGWNSVEVLDSFTIRFGLTKQPEPLANLPWIPIMPQHLLGSIKPADLRNAPFNQKPVGNGPFRFVEYKPNDRWIFDANRDFPKELGGRPNLNRLVIRIVPDENAQEAELSTGGVDVIVPVRVERIQALDSMPGVHVIEKEGRRFSFIGWNTRRPPLNDARVRRALGYAINRDRIVQVVRGGRAKVAVGPVPPFHWSYDANIRPLPYNPDSARALLAAAGLKNPQIELKLPARNRTNADLAELVRADLEAVGVHLVLRPLDFNTMIADVTSPERKFQAVVMGWESDFRLVVRDMFHSSSIDNPFQFASYSNPEVDRILDQLETTTDRKAAAPLWQRFQTVIRDEQPWTFLYYYSEILGVRDRLQGTDMDIRGAFINLPRWWVKQ
jgi:peptide/nickel transport system substrate-binding protein